MTLVDDIELSQLQELDKEALISLVIVLQKQIAEPSALTQ